MKKPLVVALFASLILLVGCKGQKSDDPFYYDKIDTPGVAITATEINETTEISLSNNTVKVESVTKEIVSNMELDQPVETEVYSMALTAPTNAAQTIDIIEDTPDSIPEQPVETLTDPVTEPEILTDPIVGPDEPIFLKADNVTVNLSMGLEEIAHTCERSITHNHKDALCLIKPSNFPGYSEIELNSGEYTITWRSSCGLDCVQQLTIIDDLPVVAYIDGVHDFSVDFGTSAKEIEELAMQNISSSGIVTCNLSNIEFDKPGTYIIQLVSSDGIIEYCSLTIKEDGTRYAINEPPYEWIRTEPVELLNSELNDDLALVLQSHIQYNGNGLAWIEDNPFLSESFNGEPGEYTVMWKCTEGYICLQLVTIIDDIGEPIVLLVNDCTISMSEVGGWPMVVNAASKKIIHETPSGTCPTCTLRAVSGLGITEFPDGPGHYTITWADDFGFSVVQNIILLP